MQTIPIRGQVKYLLEIDALLIFGAKLFMQLNSKSDFAQMFSEASGLSIIATEFIALWYPLNRLSLKWSSAGKTRHLATTALSSLAAGFLAVHIILPFAGFPPGSSILATLLLQLGFFLILPVPVLLILHRLPLRSPSAGSTNDAVLHGRSILLVNDKRKTALCILQIAIQVPNPTSPSRNRLFTVCQSEDPEVTNEPPPELPHLTPSRNNIPEFSIEFTTKSDLVSANFLVSSTDSDAERAIRSAEQKTEELRSVLQARFHKNIEFLEDNELWTTYKSLLGEHPACDPRTLWSTNKNNVHHVPSKTSKNLVEQTTGTQEPD